MNWKQILFFGAMCGCMLPGICGCGSKQPSDADLRKEFASKKKFNMNDIPPETRVKMEAFMKNHGQASAPVANTPSGQ